MAESVLKPWVISIISTDYDLHDLRSALNSHLQNLGFETSVFEEQEDGFPIEPDTHSHEACRIAIQKADIVILVLDKRYGGTYLGIKGNKSITHVEYERALELGKIVIPCVRNKLEQDRYHLNSRAKKELKDMHDKKSCKLEDILKTYEPNYAEKIELILFLEQIRKAEPGTRVSNFTTYFDSVEDLKTKITGRLKGLSRYLCQRIMEEQMNTVKRMRSSSVLWHSIGDTVERGFFIEPPFRLRSGEIDNGASQNASEILSKSVLDEKNILLIGGAGVGKTTLISKVYLDNAMLAAYEKSNKFHFYVNLRGLGVKYRFNIEKFLEEQFLILLAKKPYPVMDISSIDVYLYIDGLDEIQENCTESEIDAFAKNNLVNHPFTLCARTDFAHRIINTEGILGNIIDVIIELEEWSLEVSYQYVDRFCNINEIKGVSEEFNYHYVKTEEGKFLSSPLLVTMFLYIVEESEMSLPLEIKDEIQLFDRFINYLSTREIARIGIPGEKLKMKSGKLQKVWELAAWEIYKSRSVGETLFLNQLEEKLTKQSLGYSDILDTDAFRSLLDVKPYTNEVTGMLHEQFLEFLVARFFTECCALKIRKIVEDYLRYNIRYKINSFIKAIWSKQDKRTIDKSMDFIWRLLRNGLKLCSEQGVPQAVNAIYYLSYAKNPLAEKSIKRLRQIRDMTRDIYTRNSAYFGLIRLGDIDGERILYNDLIHNPEADSINRGAHLVYFRDWMTSQPPPHIDDGSLDWRNTFTGLLNHIISTEKRYVYSKRIDLWTIHSLMISRKSRGPFEDIHIAQMKKALLENMDLWPDYEELLSKAEEELDAIESDWLSIGIN